MFGLSIDTILGNFKLSDINTYVTAIAGIVCGAIFLNLSLKIIERGEKKIYLGVMGITFILCLPVVLIGLSELFDSIRYSVRFFILLKTIGIHHLFV